jgi:hypothetical protein
MTYSGGRIHSGLWEQGINVSEGITVTGGVTWQGQLPGSGDTRTIFWGVLYCAASETCLNRAGSFEITAGGQFILQGPGVVMMRDGRQRKGNWRDDAQEGYGAMLDAKGGMLEQGNYRNGAL